MNTQRFSRLRLLTTVAALLLAAAFMSACDIGSVDSTTAVLADNTGTIYNYSGLYARVDTNSVQQPLVFPPGRQTGRAVTWIRLLQYGSSLEAYDNAGMSWDGSISSVQSGTASFNLRGRTTAGAAVDVAGALRYADQNSTMDATWIEPGFSGSILARATVSPAATNNPVTSLAIAPTSVTLNTNQDSQSFSASGGTPPYTWTVSNSSLGTVSPTTGSSTLYTSTRIVGINRISVTDSRGTSKSADANYVSTATSTTTDSSSSSGVIFSARAKTHSASSP
ncbi:MAG: hypothetical protein GX548_03930 [Lentisphaerae bacterium]|nr:hypothetical protein [Lentisphaerota bacterium]